MKTVFTPSFITQKHQRKLQALFLILALTPLVIYQLTLNAAATDTTTWNATNFAAGTKMNTEVKNGVISLPVMASTTDSTFSDFSEGESAIDPLALTAHSAGGGLEINQGYSYTNSTPVSLPSQAVHDTFLNNGVMYLGTDNGLAVVDTKGTDSPYDDTLVTVYNTGSTPALGGNTASNIFLSNNILYVSTNGGLTIINTQGTLSSADDILVTTYSITSLPALGDNNVYSTHLDGNLLYINTVGGLAVINTQGTFADASDDVLVVNYGTGSVPALASSDVFTSFRHNNLLYVGVWGGGLYVIDTKGTLSAADDTIAARYYSDSTPGIIGSNGQYSFLDNNLLYIGNWGAGLTVIDTKGTATSSDDTLVTRYSVASTPALAENRGFSASVVNNLLYVGSYLGLTVIDTKGTVDPSDDALVKVYNTKTDPKIAGDGINQFFFNNNNLLISNNGGLSVLTPNKYYTPGTYISSARPIATTPTTPTTTITMSASTTAGQTVGLSYRTGNSGAVWQDDFNDNSTSEYLGDFYGWGDPFQTAVESAGTMKLSNPQSAVSGDDEYVDFWLDTGFPNNHFATGTVVTARVRINSNTRMRQAYNDFIYNDNWWDSYDIFIPNNEWTIMTFKAKTRAFSKIGFDINWKTGTWSPSDTFEIDWIKVTTPDTMGNWGSWISCPDQKCVLPNLGSAAWLQYKLDLTTTDPSSTPVVHSVSYNGPYQTTGTYTSTTTVYAKPVNLMTFNAVAATPTGTTIAYQYSTDGTTWKPVSPGDTLKGTVTSFTWRATLTTTDPTQTPTITSVTLTTTPYKPTTGTSLTTQVAHLEQNGQTEAVDTLKQEHPEFFNGRASKQDVQVKIVSLLGEAVDKMRELVELRGK